MSATLLRCAPLALLAGIAIEFRVAAQTSVPQLINYQGQLLDTGGTPAANGNYTMEIRLHATDIGDTVVWGPEVFDGLSTTGHTARVTVIQGNFNVVLGPKDTANRDLATVVGTNSQLFLELKVGANPPISPRQQLLTAPYAFNSKRMEGFGWSDLFSNGNPINGALALKGTAASVALDPGGNLPALDAGARIRLRQGSDPFSAGVWLRQNNWTGDRAFIGVVDDDEVGIWGDGYGYGIRMNISNGNVSLPAGISMPGPWGSVTQIHETPGFFYDVFTIDAPGSVQINTARTDFNGPVYATSFTSSSDRRVKKNIQEITEPLKRVGQIRGVRFEFDSESPIARDHQINLPNGPQAGLIAQDVREVLPEATSESSDGVLGVNYNALTGLLIEAVKEQQKQIEQLQREIAALKQEQH